MSLASRTYRLHIRAYAHTEGIAGHSSTFPQIQVSPVYFDCADVKPAIHAHPTAQWMVCTTSAAAVLPFSDQNAPSLFHVLLSVIVRSVRTVIMHGLADFVLLADG